MKQIKCACIIVLAGILSSCSRKEETSPIRKNIETAVFGSGHIEQSDEYLISATTNAIVDSILVHEGDQVGVNDLIAILQNDVQDAQLQDAYAVYHDAQKNLSDNAPQLLQLKAQITQAQEQLNLDKVNYERYKELRSQNSVSQLDLDKIELQYITSRENLNVIEKRYKETKDALQLRVDRGRIQVDTQLALQKDYRLTADMPGEVIAVYQKKGELIRTGQPLVKIGSGDYRIKLYISENDITKIEIGQSVAVHLNTYPHEIFDATVIEILPGFNESEQSYEVEAVFEQLPQKMFSGTQVQANINTGTKAHALVIPAAYLSRGKYVTLKDGSQREITVGNRNAEWVEIISGITENDVIIKK